MSIYIYIWYINDQYTCIYIYKYDMIYLCFIWKIWFIYDMFDIFGTCDMYDIVVKRHIIYDIWNKNVHICI